MKQESINMYLKKIRYLNKVFYIFVIYIFFVLSLSAKPLVRITNECFYSDHQTLQLSEGENFFLISNIPSDIDTTQLLIISDSCQVVNYQVIKDNYSSLSSILNNPFSVTLNNSQVIIGNLHSFSDSIIVIEVNNIIKQIPSSHIFEILDRFENKIDITKSSLLVKINCDNPGSYELKYKYLLTDFDYTLYYQGILKDSIYTLNGYFTLNNTTNADIKNYKIVKINRESGNYFVQKSLQNNTNFFQEAILTDQSDLTSPYFINISDDFSINNQEKKTIEFLGSIKLNVKKKIVFDFYLDLRYVLESETPNEISDIKKSLYGPVYNFIPDSLGFLNFINMMNNTYEKEDYIFFGAPMGITRTVYDGGSNKKAVKFTNNTDEDIDLYLEASDDFPFKKHSGLKILKTVKNSIYDSRITYHYKLKKHQSVKFKARYISKYKF